MAYQKLKRFFSGYFSGSTGKPKGVAMTHGALVNLLHWQYRSDLRFPQRTAQFAALGFDVSFQEIFSTICFGGELVLIPNNDIRRDPTALAEFLSTCEIQRLFIPFSALKLLAHTLLEQEVALPKLQAVITAGEQLCIDPVIRQCFSHLPGCRLHNHYGPTETHVATAFTLPEQINEWAPLPPIGNPIGNTKVYVLDQHRQPVPIEVTGEIYIGGAGIARGYLHQPGLTAERFLPDPFSLQAGARLYRTGDLGRWRADGTLEYLGRNDSQIKLRGFRIEPGEIEAQLLACACVREALVIVREDNVGDPRLVAYLIIEANEEMIATALREQLAAHLPEYMLPSAFVVLDHWPLTPNGKLDRAALPAPGQTALVTRPYELPQGEFELAIAVIWQDLLKVAKVGRHDDFFMLGGHSLLAVQFVGRLHQVLNRNVPLRDIFAHPILSDLARMMSDVPQHVLIPLSLANRQQALPLSFAQQRLWFLARSNPAASAAYHRLLMLRLRGTLDELALQTTLDHLVARHESLRTTFVLTDGQPTQRIASPDYGFALVKQDLRDLSDKDRIHAVTRAREEAADQPFDLAAGPLIYGRLLRLADDEYLLLLAHHFIICDGWSNKILMRECCTLYTAFSEGRPSPLPALALQYADYVAWQRKWVSNPSSQTHLDFWKEHLKGAPQQDTGCLDPRRDRHRSLAFVDLLAVWYGHSDLALGKNIF